jgi:hypothetical protein
MHNCPAALVAQYEAYDMAFSHRDVVKLESIETSDFRDTDPDGSVRNLMDASENQRRFFAIGEDLHLRSSVRCDASSGGSVKTVATMSIDGKFTGRDERVHSFNQIYINHDVWRNVNGTWRLAAQTTVALDGVWDGKPVHLRLAHSQH